jgi:hypothetical protein
MGIYCLSFVLPFAATENVKPSINLAQRVNEGPKSCERMKIYCLSRERGEKNSLLSAFFLPAYRSRLSIRCASAKRVLPPLPRDFSLLRFSANNNFSFFFEIIFRSSKELQPSALSLLVLESQLAAKQINI